MNYIHQEMITMGADGVVFHSIGAFGQDVLKYGFEEYTLDTIESAVAFPKSGRSYYKLINGKKVLFDYSKQAFVEKSSDSAKDKIGIELNKILDKLGNFTVGELEDDRRYHAFMQLCGYRDGLRFGINMIEEEENNETN